MQRHRFYGIFFFCFLIVTFFLQSATFAAIIRVKPDGNNANSGADWAHAKQTVSAAITAAAQGDQIWVAAGTYNENIASRVSAGQAIDVTVYGGFAGTETARSQRNIGMNQPIIDGGGIPTIVMTSNAGYLVSTLDGFTVQNGGLYTGGSIPGAMDGHEGRGAGRNQRAKYCGGCRFGAAITVHPVPF